MVWMKVHIFGDDEPTKLIVGGLHGREWRVATLLLPMVQPRSIHGRVIVVPYLIKGGSYISTLSQRYYSSSMGRVLLKLFDKYHPEIYLEIHGYTHGSLAKLTNPDRVHKYGVPPFYRFENDILIGCVSPYLLRKVRVNLAIAIEIPLKGDLDDKARKFAASIIKDIIEAKSSSDIWRRISRLDDKDDYKGYVSKIRMWIGRITS